MKKLPKDWVKLTPTHYGYRKNRYFPLVHGMPLEEAHYSYNIDVILSGNNIVVSIDDEEAPSVPGGAYLCDEIPIEIIELLLQERKNAKL